MSLGLVDLNLGACQQLMPPCCATPPRGMGVRDDGIMSAIESCRIWLNCHPFLVRGVVSSLATNYVPTSPHNGSEIAFPENTFPANEEGREKSVKRNQELKSNGLTSLTEWEDGWKMAISVGKRIKPRRRTIKLQ